VDKALADCLAGGGFLLVLPSGPWPFYYDESGKAVNRSAQFGLTLRTGWEKLSDTMLGFIVRNDAIRHFSDPVSSVLPTITDLRWRPFFPQDHKQYVPLLTMRTGAGDTLGDAIAYVEHPLSYFLLWLGISIGMHAFPSITDGQSLLAQAGRAAASFNILAIISYPLVWAVYVANILRFFWLNYLYGVGIGLGLPALIFQP
jgi:hypothetical protein